MEQLHMFYTICELHKNRIISYEVRVYCGTERRHVYKAMSEAGIRSWLAEQGIPFSRQHKFLTVIKE